MSPLNSVRRDEILSRDSTSRSPSPQPDSSFQDAHQRLGALLNLDALIAPAESTAPTPALKEDGHQQEDEEQEFEFRLFSAPAAPKCTTKDEEAPATEGGETAVSRGTQKLRIRLRSPTPGAVDGEGRFLNPFRGWQYYFTTPELLSDSGAKQDPASASTNRRKQFEEVAVTGQQMLRWSEVSWVCVGLSLVSLGFDIVCLFLFLAARVLSTMAGYTPQAATYQATSCICRSNCGRDYLHYEPSDKRPKVSKEARQEATYPVAEAKKGGRGREAEGGREAKSQEPGEENQTETKGTRIESCSCSCSCIGTKSRCRRSGDEKFF